MQKKSASPNDALRTNAPSLTLDFEEEGCTLEVWVEA